MQSAEVLQAWTHWYPGTWKSTSPLTQLRGGAQPTSREHGSSWPGSSQKVTAGPMGTMHS